MSEMDDDIHSIDQTELVPSVSAQTSDEESMLGVARQDFLGKVAHFPEGQFKGKFGTINGTIEGTHYFMSVVDLQRRPSGQQDRVLARPVNQEIIKIMRMAALEEEREQKNEAAVAASASHVEKSSKRIVKKRTPYEFDESEAPPRKQQSSSSSSRSRQQTSSSSSSSSNTNGRSGRGQNGGANAGVESSQGWAGNNIQFRMLDAKNSNPQQAHRSHAGIAAAKAYNHYDDDDMDDDDDSDSDVAVEQYDRRDGRVLLRFRSIENASKRTNIPAARVERLCESDHSYLDRHDPSASAKRTKTTGNDGEGNLLWRYCTEIRNSPYDDERGQGPNRNSYGNRSQTTQPAQQRASQSTSQRHNLNYAKTSSSSGKGAAAAASGTKHSTGKPIVEKKSTVETKPVVEKKEKKKGNTQYDLLFHQPVDCLNANNCKFVQRFENVHTAATTHKVLASDLQFAIQCGNSCRGFLWKYSPSATNGSASAAASTSRRKAKPAAAAKVTTHVPNSSSSSSSSSSSAAAAATKKKDYMAATAKLGKSMSSSSSAGARGGGSSSSSSSSSSSAGGGSRNHSSGGGVSSSSSSSSSKNGSQPKYQPAMKQPRNIAAHIAASIIARGSGAKRPSPSETYYEEDDDDDDEGDADDDDEEEDDDSDDEDDDDDSDDGSRSKKDAHGGSSSSSSSSGSSSSSSRHVHQSRPGRNDAVSWNRLGDITGVQLNNDQLIARFVEGYKDRFTHDYYTTAAINAPNP